MTWFVRSKIGPALERELNQIRLAGNSRQSVEVVVACNSNAIRSFARNHDVEHVSESLPFAKAKLLASDIRRLVRDRNITLLDLDETFSCVPEPLKGTKTRMANVFDRYKVGPMQDLNGEGIRVQIQDTGLSPHRAFPEQLKVIDFTGEGTTKDLAGHGNATYSQMKARGPYPGLIPEADVTMARIFGRTGQTSVSAMLRAHASAIENEANVVSMSYGGPRPRPIIAWAIKRMHGLKINLFAAAGNSGPSKGTIEYPAGYREVIAVAAVDKQGRLAPFSSRGRPGQSPMKPDISAEGSDLVLARSPDGTMGRPVDRDYTVASGTSFSCPIAAALGAMILQANSKRLSPTQLREILVQSARR